MFTHKFIHTRNTSSLKSRSTRNLLMTSFMLLVSSYCGFAAASEGELNELPQYVEFLSRVGAVIQLGSLKQPELTSQALRLSLRAIKASKELNTPFQGEIADVYLLPNQIIPHVSYRIQWNLNYLELTVPESAGCISPSVITKHFDTEVFHALEENSATSSSEKSGSKWVELTIVHHSIESFWGRTWGSGIRTSFSLSSGCAKRVLISKHEP
jgi:hypothetical protein